MKNNKTTNAMQSILVTNPFSGLQTDVMPLFSSMNGFFSAYSEGEKISDIACVVIAIQGFIDYTISTAFSGSEAPEDTLPIIVGLTELRNMFKEMKELK